MIRVLFDSTEINGNYIQAIHQTVKPFKQYFSIGNVVCREFDIDINKNGYSTIPDVVYLYEDNNSQTQSNWTKIATLLVDDYDNQNDRYTSFTLTDIMVRFNKTLEYNLNETLLTILQNVCTAHGISLINNSFYMDDFPITWNDNITERELISYIAEVNGGYAYIDADGNLNIAQYSNTVAGTVDADMCSAISVGETHHIDRVYIELSTDTRYYPSTSTYDTLYLNSNNILFTNSTAYPMNDVLQHIYSVVNGLIFTDMKIDRCPVTSARACQMLKLINFGTDIPFICTIDYEYSVNWYGGYDSQFDSQIQEETKSGGQGNLDRRISIIVDRETGTITQQINELADGLTQATTEFNQTANSLELRVSNTETGLAENSSRMSSYETVVNIQADGVRISQGTQGAYVLFTDSGMEIYVEGTKTAWAEADGFSSSELMIGGPNELQKWHLHEANDGATLMFLRR